MFILQHLNDLEVNNVLISSPPQPLLIPESTACMPALPHAWKIPSSEDTERSQKGVERTEGVAAEAQLDAVRGEVGLQHSNTPSPTGRAPPGFGSATPPGPARAAPRPGLGEKSPKSPAGREMGALRIWGDVQEGM